jgi:hypothetical protein
MTVPRTLRIASQGQSTVCPSRLLQVSKHLSDEPLATRAGPARPSSGRPRSTTDDRGRQTLEGQPAGQRWFGRRRASSRSESITSTTSSRPQSVAAGHGPASVTPVAEAGPSANRLLTAGSRKRLATLGNRVALDARRHVAVGVEGDADRGMAELARLTTFGCSPASSAIVAQPCRRSWNPPRSWIRYPDVEASCDQQRLYFGVSLKRQHSGPR